LSEDALVDELKRACSSGHPADGEEKAGHDRLDAVRRRASKEGLRDMSAIVVEADMAAEIVVYPLVGEGAQEGDQRKRRPQQRGSKAVIQLTKSSALSSRPISPAHDAL
jgi:hypothetical protein